MKISDYLKKEFCIMDLKATTKEQAIREVASCLTVNGKIKDKEKFINDILERESLGSTGIGHKVAIPHSRTEVVNGFAIGFGRSKEGIDFKALDGDKVNLIFLMGANPSELNLYLRLLAELSRLLMENSFRRELLSVNTGEEVVDIIKKYEASGLVR
ncbi:MAG: PTS sugar transporter subunit IIA [Candidatus Omnitrophica bacterium]|jgi:PTS system fructose-specific IIC component|nr:PTS sugar transporter subunit IIA [Candidatus Omnitrophota bacterium]